MTSPKIASISWGSMQVASDDLPDGKDYKLYPGGGRAWDWGETRTRHRPGVQRGDVAELVSKGCTHAVLSRGMDEMLGVPDATVRWLEGQGLTVHVAETRKAVEIYNRLVDEGQKVGGVFHSTC